MSRIYFHSPSETVEVYGTELAQIKQINRELAGAIAKVTKPGMDFSTRTPYLDLDHGQILNTVLRIGSSEMGLLARIDGQVEIHGYVEPEDGDFIATLAERCLKLGVFREFIPRDGIPTDIHTGWHEAIRLFRKGEIVVSSYSVCEAFPNANVAVEGGTWTPPNDEDDDDNWDAWYELSDSEKWDLALAGLRKLNETQRLRWTSEGWSEFFFNDGRTAFDHEVKTTMTQTMLLEQSEAER